MRNHQRNIIKTIFSATDGSNKIVTSDFEFWLSELETNRGELDRKKKVNPKSLESSFEFSPGSFDLNRFIYSVERYLMIKCFGIIELCIEQELGAKDQLPIVLQKTLPIRNELVSFLESEHSADLSKELTEASEFVSGISDSPLSDSLQIEFMSLIPRQVRHAIGSFYTPQWLARHTLRKIGYRWEDPSSLKRTLCDPSCGSGVFLIAASEEVRQAVSQGLLSKSDGLEIVRNNLLGIDIELVPCLLTLTSLVIAAKCISQTGHNGVGLISEKIFHMDSLGDEASEIKAEIVVGNPPWVNWEYMPKQYKDRHMNLWPKLNLFDGHTNTFSFSKEDISALFVAHAVCRRLLDNGKFAFILPESLIKSTLNHRGFRKFSLAESGNMYQISEAEDFVQVKPFEGVSNRTIILYGNNSSETNYPVPFTVWSEVDRNNQPISGISELIGKHRTGAAQLSVEHDRSSSWSTGSSESTVSRRALDGKNHYRARTGLFSGGANGVYHLRVLAPQKGGLLSIENVTERAKRFVPQVSGVIEQDFVYPFLRGRDVTQWSFSTELGVVLPHTAETKMAPVDPGTLRSVAPKTLEYFNQFRSILDDRKGFSAWEAKYQELGFYACQRVGDYTFSDWKVVWRYISPRFTTAVLGPIEFAGMAAKPAIVNEKLMLIACRSKEEAYFLGGILASSLVLQHVHSRMVSTQISPAIISGISIPQFDPESPVHREISALTQKGHELVAAGDFNVIEIVNKIDENAAQIWNVPKDIAERARALNPFNF